jgi:GH15 family glucan-1,4-alpha-glucosidase
VTVEKPNYGHGLRGVDFTVYKKIIDYGIIGHLKSIALIGLDGSIDWMCLPYIDSPSIFCALLDDGKGGRFSVSPVDAWESAAEYISATNILQTKFMTAAGVMSNLKGSF